MNAQYNSLCRLAPPDTKAAMTDTARLRRTPKKFSICRCGAWKVLLALFKMEALFAALGIFPPLPVHAQRSVPVIAFSTYLGGREYDVAEAVDVDAEGNIYITGETHSRDFPVINAYQAECRLGSRQSCADAFVMKLAPDGRSIIYSTYFGGSSNDKGYGIAADASGNAYVTGAMNNSAFVAKFDAAGRLLYQRTLDGYPITIGRAIAVDATGNAYVTGQTLSREFPLQRALQPNPGGVSCHAIGGGSAPLNAFVAKLDPAGALVYSTYLGGDGNDIGLGIAADAEGNAYVVGETSSPNFPLVNALRSAYQGGAPQPVGTCDGDDGFVAKLSPDGSALLYSTYFFRHRRIAVDPAGNAYLGDKMVKVDGSGYVSLADGAELAVDAVGQVYSLCDFRPSLGAANAPTEIFKLTVAASGELYVSGGTQATNFPVRNPLQPANGGGFDAFLAGFSGCATPLTAEHSLFVPVVLSAAGANNAFFTSELTLVNRGPTPVVFNFSYVAAFGSGSGTAFDQLAAGEQRVVPDAIAYLRSLGVPIPDSGDRGGTLRITFSGLRSPNDAAVLVRTTTAAPGGRAGLAYAAVPNSALLRGTTYVCGLRQNAWERSNVAIQNAGTEEDGDVVLRLTLISGDPAAPATQTLADEILSPGTFKQLSGILHSQGASISQGYVRIEKVAGKAPYYAFGVVNDQANSDGSFIPAVAEELAGREGMVLPVVVEGSLFSTELVVTNWSDVRKVVHLTYFADAVQASGNIAHRYLELLPGQQIIISSFVQSLRERGIPGIASEGSVYAGMLTGKVEDGDLSGIYMAARTSAPGGGGRYGVAYSAVPFGASASGSVWLYGLQQDANNRTNLALVNTGEVDSSPSVFTIEVFDGDGGRKVTTVDGVLLNATDWRQLPAVMAQSAPGVVQGYARITRVAGSNPFIAYAVINDGGQPGERTGDGAFVAGSP